MFKTLRAVETKTLNHSGRSYVGETLQLEGDLRTSGSFFTAWNGSLFWLVAAMMISIKNNKLN